ncbi:MAG TPA: GNAT family N-acetyltransferase [Roseiflexaceae bacterium]|nr:GNAT family N-acetyltransferase [Roseiflexaceae bacterium]
MSDAELDSVTAGAGIFLDRGWLRLLGAVEVPALARGELRLRYIVARRGSTVVGVCPFLVTRSRSIHYHYSLEKFFFLSWRDELARMNPDSAGRIRLLSACVDAYRRLARVAGSGIEGWVLAASPLSFRGGMAVMGATREERDGVRQRILQTLQEIAADERLPLCVYGVEESDTELRQACTSHGLDELFLVYDNVLPTPFKRLDDYFALFPRKRRYNLRQEMRQAESAGFRFERIADFGALGPSFEKLYLATYSKYGEEYFLHPPSFWEALPRHAGSRAEAIVAYKDSQPLGFVLLLHKGDTLWPYRVGRAEGGEKELPIYFNLVFYEPLKRAIELGTRRLVLGGGAWEAKRHRGTQGLALYSYFRFPHLRSRALLKPYLSLFTRISQSELNRVVRLADSPTSDPEAVA